MKLCIITVTRNGDKIAYKIKDKFKYIYIYSKFKDSFFKFNEISCEAFKKYDGIIFITSTGIAVRAIAPYIETKDKDPAVICIDNSGKFVISLLSGHIGGANELTLEIAKLLNSIPVITTATDNMEIEAPDIIAKKNSLVMDNLKDAKKIASLLVDKRNVYFYDERNIIKTPIGYCNDLKNSFGIVYITDKIKLSKTIVKENFPKLKLIRRDIVLGIGCKKNYDRYIMRNTVLSILEKYNLDYRAVKSIGTINIKKDEKAIINLSNFLNCKLNIFAKKQIKDIEGQFEGSNFVEKIIGVRCVAEPCVVLQNAKIITNKLKLNGMTLCIGIKKE